MSLSTSSPTPRSLPSLLSHHRHPFSSSSITFSLPRPRLHSQPSAVSLKSSWSPPDDPLSHNFNGWAPPDTPPPANPKKSGFPTVFVAGVGTSVALLLAAVAHFSFNQRGFGWKFRKVSPESSITVTAEGEEKKDSDVDSTGEENAASDAVQDEPSDVVAEPLVLEKLRPRIITVTVDPSQQEAVHLLKKLKIMDEDVKADELCTRRAYAKWLVRASTLLERNPKYKLTTTAALSGSMRSAFDDVNVGDQDFGSIQALAEAGVLPSKLFLPHNSDGNFNFSPERFISRRDLIDWRAQLEYDFITTTGNQEMLKQRMNLLDVREISSDESPGLRMDMLAGDKSLLRRVFGQLRRLQPNKPSTIAHAAVALISGRVTEAIRNELLRLEADECSRQVAKEAIKQELLDRGDIEKYWGEKMEREKARGLEVQLLHMDALNNLEQEKIVQENAFSGFLKEKAAMDCQKQLLYGLKEEVKEMSERLVSERAELIAEEETAQILRRDLQTKKEGVLDAKSVLEAEIEALRILRSWIEDEARKSNARSKVLEEVGRRWKCDQQ